MGLFVVWLETYIFALLVGTHQKICKQKVVTCATDHNLNPAAFSFGELL